MNTYYLKKFRKRFQIANKDIGSNRVYLVDNLEKNAVEHFNFQAAIQTGMMRLLDGLKAVRYQIRIRKTAERNRYHKIKTLIPNK